MKFKYLLIIIFFLCFCKTSFAYERIISLGPATTEALFLLGAGDRLVGCTVYCQNPVEAKKKEKIGTVIEVNIEKVVSLKPDLVLATSLTDVQSAAKLKSLGINVITFSLAKNYLELCDNFLKLGELAGKKEEAKKIVEDSKNKVESIRKKFKNSQKTTVFVELGSKPLFALTKDSFGNDFIEFAGGINIVKDLKVGFYSREEVLKNNPDVIIVADMGIAGEEEKKVWEGYKVLRASRNKRIHVFDAYALCSPTPVSFVGTLEEMVKILQP
ncbi:MAG: ABC transporter substrate-binding protein [bacterium]